MSTEYPEGPEYLKRAFAASARLKACRSPRVDPVTISIKTKVPSNALCLRETMLYRVSELAEAALTCYQNDQIVAFAILTRAIVESFAVFYCLLEELERCVAKQSTGEVNDFLKRALVGTRNGLTPLDAHHVLDTIDVVTKGVPIYRRLYDELCEIAHPNYGGVLGAYGKLNPKRVWWEFGAIEAHKPFLGALVGLLESFETYYHRMTPLLRDFAALCDREFDEGKTPADS